MQIPLEEAAAQLSQIIDQAAKTQKEVILTRNNLAVAKITPVNPSQGSGLSKPRRPGSAIGIVTVPDDFNAPLNDFDEYL